MFRGETALEHRTRRMIFNYISSNPGVSFGRIRDYFELNDSTLKYHLKYLERRKEITSKREGRLRCYFCYQNNGFDLNQLPQHTRNQLNQNQLAILNTICANPGITRDRLGQRLKIHRKTLEYNLERLIGLKLIWKVKNSNEVGYEFITKESLRQEVYNRLLVRLLSGEISEDTFVKVKRKLEIIDMEDLMEL
jgi:predicted transcriptional regulator